MVYDIPKEVLVVEDDRFVREAACKVLTESGFNVLAAESAAAAQARFFVDSERVDVVLCDAMLLDGSGVHPLRVLHLIATDVEVTIRE